MGALEKRDHQPALAATLAISIAIPEVHNLSGACKIPANLLQTAPPSTPGRAESVPPCRPCQPRTRDTALRYTRTWRLCAPGRGRGGWVMRGTRAPLSSLSGVHTCTSPAGYRLPARQYRSSHRVSPLDTPDTAYRTPDRRGSVRWWPGGRPALGGAARAALA